MVVTTIYSNMKKHFNLNSNGAITEATKPVPRPFLVAFLIFHNIDSDSTAMAVGASTLSIPQQLVRLITARKIHDSSSAFQP